MRWPIRRVVECYTHGFCEIGPSGIFGERSHWWLIEKGGINLAEDSPTTFLDFSNIFFNAGSNIYFVVVSVIQLWKPPISIDERSSMCCIRSALELISNCTTLVIRSIFSKHLMGIMKKENPGKKPARRNTAYIDTSSRESSSLS